MLKAIRKKCQVTYKKFTRITTNCSTENLKAWSKRKDIFQAMKVNNYQQRVLYTAKFPNKIKGDLLR
jgi:hypothetical protein